MDSVSAVVFDASGARCDLPAGPRFTAAAAAAAAGARDDRWVLFVCLLRERLPDSICSRNEFCFLSELYRSFVRSLARSVLPLAAFISDITIANYREYD